MKKVVKFGGSSSCQCGTVPKGRGDHQKRRKPQIMWCLLHPGKRFDGDTKVTDMLYACYEAAEAGQDFSGKLQAIKERFQEIIRGLSLDTFSWTVSLSRLLQIFQRMQGKSMLRPEENS